MPDRRALEAEEEALRQRVRALPESARRAVYEAARVQLKDPDTYAALNWFLVVGLHHFYLRRWWRGAADVAVVGAGVALLFSGRLLMGVLLIVAVGIAELWTLFHAQRIVQAWNNACYRRLLAQHEAPGHAARRAAAGRSRAQPE
ncbi:TM2 domain-containing protein [Algiphilus sp.]|uniref:TM2 domain-containing protein n=1 Tax=Algiphilus sp. TaxID=1872431 RepID=UPI0032ED4D22